MGKASGPADATRFGLVPLLGTTASIAACYADFLVGVVASAAAATAPTVNEHVQAVAMWGLALVAVGGLAWERRRHGSALPLGLGLGGLAVIAGTLYIYYDVRILVLGYTLLVAGVLLNQNRLLAGLYGTVQRQAGELRGWNRHLEERVEQQVSEIERLSRLRRFLAPEVADLITSEGRESLLESHRRYIACLFCDLRDFTALSERMEPEDVMLLVQSYHQELGKLTAMHKGTIGYRAGDGLMVFFNDPIPCDDPVCRAVDLALDMRRAFAEWHRRLEPLGHRVGFGVGIASGYATLGVVGFEGGSDYTAIGNVVNVAARLCDNAAGGEILVNERVLGDLGERYRIEPRGDLVLKGVAKPVRAFNVAG